MDPGIDVVDIALNYCLHISDRTFSASFLGELFSLCGNGAFRRLARRLPTTWPA